jgi:hypothetical protein
MPDSLPPSNRGRVVDDPSITIWLNKIRAFEDSGEIGKRGREDPRQKWLIGAWRLSVLIRMIFALRKPSERLRVCRAGCAVKGLSSTCQE